MAEGRIHQEALPEGLKMELMPKHVAVILDGNRRWAKDKGLTMELGYVEGARSVLLGLALLSLKWGIKVVSLFAFSTENWTRPQDEVGYLMSMFEDIVKTKKHYLHMLKIRVSAIGDRSELPDSLVEQINTVEEETKSYTGLHLIGAVNYSGRYDILQASRSIATKVKDGILQIEEIDETLFEHELQTNNARFPIPDLLIRTSGEERISNFMLWQLAHTELFFCKKNLPEFGEQDYVEALLAYQRSRRHFDHS